MDWQEGRGEGRRFAQTLCPSPDRENEPLAAFAPTRLFSLVLAVGSEPAQTTRYVSQPGWQIVRNGCNLFYLTRKPHNGAAFGVRLDRSRVPWCDPGISAQTTHLLPT